MHSSALLLYIADKLNVEISKRLANTFCANHSNFQVLNYKQGEQAEKNGEGKQQRAKRGQGETRGAGERRRKREHKVSVVLIVTPPPRRPNVSRLMFLPPKPLAPQFY